jgi:hypothetical protein
LDARPARAGAKTKTPWRDRPEMAVARGWRGHRSVVVSVATIMAKKKKDRLRVHKEARRLARMGVGMPPTERTIPDKRQKAPKHKKKLVASDLS